MDGGNVDDRCAAMGNLCPRSRRPSASPETPLDVLPAEPDSPLPDPNGPQPSGNGSGGTVPGVPPFPVPPFPIPDGERSDEHTYVGKRKQLYCRHGFNLAIMPGGKVVGVDDPFSKFAILEVVAVDVQEVRMRAVETGLYIAMDGKGKLYGERDADEIGCIFIEQLDGGYLTYLSKKNAHLGWYLGLKQNGKAKPGPNTKFGQKAVQFLARRATRS